MASKHPLNVRKWSLGYQYSRMMKNIKTLKFNCISYLNVTTIQYAIILTARMCCWWSVHLESFPKREWFKDIKEFPSIDVQIHKSKHFPTSTSERKERPRNAMCAVSHIATEFILVFIPTHSLGTRLVLYMRKKGPLHAYRYKAYEAQ